MTYYFISLDSGRFGKFQREIAFLGKGTWVNNKKRLLEVLNVPALDPVFFLHLQEEKNAINEMAMIIRDTWDGAKLIYLSEGMETAELKEHQSSKAGGDAYVHLSVTEDFLYEMVQSLKENGPKFDMTSPKVNKLDVVQEVSISTAPIRMDEPVKKETSAHEMEEIFSDLTALKKMIDHPISKAMDDLFKNVMPKQSSGIEIPGLFTPPPPKKKPAPEVSMSDKDQELSLDDLGELEIGLSVTPSVPQDDGMSLSLGDVPDLGADLELGGAAEPPDMSLSGDLDLGGGLDITMGRDLSEENNESSFGDLSLGDDDGDDGMDFSLDDDAPEEGTLENLGDLDLSLDAAPAPQSSDEESAINLTAGLDFGSDEPEGLDLGQSDDSDAGLDLGDSGGGLSLVQDDNSGLDLGESDELDLNFGGGEVSNATKKKMKEIDDLMDEDASQASISLSEIQVDDSLGMDMGSGLDNLEESLVSDDLNLDSISFGNEDDATSVISAKQIIEEVEEEEIEEKPKKKKKEPAAASRESSRGHSEDFKEISGAYSGEMERTQATISNLRADRNELLAKIQQLEENQVLHNRQTLTMRAELDERKIELTIIRRKLNEEINDLKERLKMQEERKLILEEKNKILLQELDKAGQKNKIDIKKVQMRERELEQKLELLKSDSENQIKNRDLKILELKRKIDAMEFDMESISQQEKRSVDSRFELEDKLDKAIKTLRSAISVLEDESDRGNALDALKKNIDV